MARFWGMIGGVACAALLAGNAAAQALGPGGAVIVPVTPGPNAARVDPSAISPNYLDLDGNVVRVGPGGSLLVPAARGTFDVGTPPAGYRPAFDDQRVNPFRGPRTLLGDAQQDGVWTREVPRRLQPVIQVLR